ncbi:hypothetical protein [Fibrella arboris]|uniref:hypothetical protein n=1 Tax=Fibrella arboris TaxID=3242486 RepID=UPI0035208FFC
MARQDAKTEYIISQAAYETALASLPTSGTEQQRTYSVPVTAYEYRLNTSQTINAGKWSMWAVMPESFAFEWRNGSWHPPANLVVRQE